MLKFALKLVAAAALLGVTLPAQAAVTYTVVHEGTFASGGLTVASFSCTSGRTLLAYAQGMSNAIDAQVGTVLSATGWTAITGTDNSSSPGWGYAGRAFTKTCGGATDSFAGSATWAAGAATNYAKVTILELQGQHATTPFRTVGKDVIDQAETSTTNFTLSQATLSDSLTVAFVIIASNGGTQTIGAGPSGGFTERHESGVADWVFYQWQDRTGSTSTTIDWATSTGLAGGVSVAIEIAAAAGGSDGTPDAFSFTDQSSVSLSSTITSAAVTITGIDTSITCSATGGTIDKNSDGNFQSSQSIANNDQIRARHTSSGSNSTAVNTVVDCGGVTDTFTSTTLAAGPTLPVFMHHYRQMKRR